MIWFVKGCVRGWAGHLKALSISNRPVHGAAFQIELFLQLINDLERRHGGAVHLEESVVEGVIEGVCLRVG